MYSGISEPIVDINFEKNFSEIEDSGKKMYIDDEQYQYSVKKPDYLSWNGNLSLAEKDMEYVLIIWPNAFQKNMYEWGIMLDVEDKVYQIELSDAKTAKDELKQPIIDQNRKIISTMVDKANRIWRLNLQ